MTVPTPTTRSRFARRACAVLALSASVILCASAVRAGEARFVSANFVVSASTDTIAEAVAAAAEESRQQFGSQWLDGEVLPPWKTPCHIIVQQSETGGNGSVTYERYRGAIENVRIVVRGPLDRILEYVLPHEVAHATLAIALAQPVPRWADEGVALLSESQNQRIRQQQRVSQLVTTDSLMPLDEILSLEQYPKDHRQLVGFYASSFSLTEYLVSQGGRARLLEFARDGRRLGWERALSRHYDTSLDELESAWHERITLAAGHDLSDLPQVAAVDPTQP